jgi:hypothetical protein
MPGCGGGGDEPQSADNHGYGWEFDAASKNGLRLRKTGATTADADLLEAIAEGVEACSGINAAPPPFVIVVPKDSLGANVGFYLPSPPLILIDESFGFGEAYAHEVLHYLLDVSTGNLDPNHQNPAFEKCFPDVIFPLEVH